MGREIDHFSFSLWITEAKIPGLVQVKRMYGVSYLPAPFRKLK